MSSLLAFGIIDQNTVVFACVLAAFGLVLLVAGWFGILPSMAVDQDKAKATGESSLRMVGTVAAAIGAFVFTGWPVLAVFAAGAGWFAPVLRNAKAERRDAITRVDAIATWVETVRDNISGAAGLSQALRNTGNNPPAAIRTEVRDLVLRLQHEPIVPSLRRFAADLAHPTSDMAIGCLILASSRSAGSLSSILAHTAQSARDGATMMRHVESGRVHSQSQAKMVALIAIGMSVLMMLGDDDFLSAYNGVGGQFVLFGVCSLAAGCAYAMYRLGRPVPANRVFRGVEISQTNALSQPLPQPVEV